MKSIDITYLQQGKVLTTKETEKWSDKQFKDANKVEQSMMFTNFKLSDEGKSRQFVARFDSPEECNKFIENHNAMIELIYEQQRRINELEEKYNDFASMF